MPRKLNIRDKVNALHAFFVKEKRMPGYNEMLRLFNYRSKNAVHGLLQQLVEKGYATKTGGKIALTDKVLGKVKLLGLIQAGFPSPAEEELLDTVTLDEFLIERPDATFMLKVSGDSMIDAGIHPGDMVLVERGVEPKSNDIVIAQVDSEWTMKYFVKDKNGVRLEPANKKYKTIRPKDSIEIGGVVRTVIRKYA
jgi:repressor LexA